MIRREPPHAEKPLLCSHTPQGRAQNDSESFMYYKNGRALTGAQTIDGAAYQFDADGVETLAIPPQIR